MTERAPTLGKTLLVRASRPSKRATRAHAMKNCLAVIHALSRTIAADVAERSRSRLACIEDETDRMLRLLSDEMNDEGTDEVLRVEAVLRALHASAAEVAAAAGVEVTVSDEGGELLGNQDALVEALSNLVRNAIQASGRGDVVSVTATRSDDAHLWTIEDRGRGMTRSVLGAIGAPFRTFRDGGSGLGVAIAQETVDRHGGLVRFESAPDEGTRVVIWLPGAARGER